MSLTVSAFDKKYSDIIIETLKALNCVVEGTEYECSHDMSFDAKGVLRSSCAVA